ncbi:DUF1444 family protein [Acidovorax sp. SUPP2539]|uniref:DUF1444 family protein n=1 Tax=Acidovorax sp. SUPP2539 TaxID=2920878 RepID=UPI0023DE45F3|nr:DUF1444 family protein [Acidovorax sp. SUPP2539]GKS88754.1 DUF1444 family protein [Acidovorax sp. SUPP2539]
MFAALFDMLFNRKPGPDTFAKRFLAALRAQGAGEDMDYDPDTFQLVGRNGRTINLHNLYQTYSNSDHRHRDEAIRSYVAAFMEGNNGESQAMTFEKVRPTLMPVLRHRAMLEEMRLVHRREHGPDAAFTVVFRDIADDCVELLAVDRTESVSPLLQGPNQEWGITLEQGLAIAHDNLRDATSDRFVEVAPGVFRGAWQDAYDTSRVLLPDVIERVAVRGRPVFMLPTRDCLLVVGDRDEAPMAAMLELSIEAASQGRCISALAYTYEERRIVPFALSQPQHLRRQDDLRRMMDASSYAMQNELLQAVHKTEQLDIFVASYRLYKENDGSGHQFSLATWTEDVDILLPKADRIAFVTSNEEGDADVVVVRWNQAVGVVGALMELQPDFYPPRYRVRSFPSSVQLQQLVQAEL